MTIRTEGRAIDRGHTQKKPDDDKEDRKERRLTRTKGIDGTQGDRSGQKKQTVTMRTEGRVTDWDTKEQTMIRKREKSGD